MSFKPIRNKLRKYTFDSLVDPILKILRDQESSNNKYAFWHSLLLLRWTLEFSGQAIKTKDASYQDVAKLLTKVSDLEKNHETFDFKKNGWFGKTFIILSHQQFKYQETAFWDSFARQNILFNELEHKHNIRKSFEDKTGISISIFLELTRFFWIYLFHGDKANLKFYGTIPENLISSLKKEFSKSIFDKYVDLLSISRESISSFLENDTRLIRNYDLQVFETSIFTRKPFLLYNNKIHIPHKDLFNQTCNHFIYDYLKNRDPVFPEELGNRMEKYIQKGLDEISLKSLNGKEIKSLFGLNDKSPDFLVNDNIIIEAKAIEVKPYVGINPTDDILGNEFKKNLVKAYTQQMLTLTRKLKVEKCWGIIITYKNLYLGNSADIWDQFLKKEFEKLNISNEKLPIDHLFIMDLQTWDKTMQVVKSNGISLERILEKVKHADAESQSRKFSFHMHLEEYEIQNYNLTYLNSAKKLNIKKSF